MTTKLEICSNSEWLSQCLDADSIRDGYEDEAGNYFAAELHRRLMAAGYETESARGQRMLYHGWNGANTFAHKIGPVATFDTLEPAEESEIEGIVSAAKADAEAAFAAQPDDTITCDDA
jgi:hypothetical protein